MVHAVKILRTIIFFCKGEKLGQEWWLMSVTPAAQEAEIGMILV
jgi:hypothetical protein